MIDDATNRTFARFYPRENLDAAFDVFGRWASARGLPRALYVDRAGIYRADREPTAEELLAGEEPATQFGRAMGELDVEWHPERGRRAACRPTGAGGMDCTTRDHCSSVSSVG